MRQPHLPDDALSSADVPADDAPWAELVAFGHRYHAYKVAGSLPRVAGIAVEVHEAWAEGRLDDETLPRLRIALFHTVRALDHGAPPDDDTAAWVRAVVAAVAERAAAGTG